MTAVKFASAGEAISREVESRGGQGEPQHRFRATQKHRFAPDDCASQHIGEAKNDATTVPMTSRHIIRAYAVVDDGEDPFVPSTVRVECDSDVA